MRQVTHIGFDTAIGGWVARAGSRRTHPGRRPQGAAPAVSGRMGTEAGYFFLELSSGNSW